MMHVALCPLRRQSSPRRIWVLPSLPVCSMLNAIAIVMWKIEQDIGSLVCCRRKGFRPPRGCLERAVHPAQLDLRQNLIEHEVPVVVDFVGFEFVPYVFAILVLEVFHGCGLKVFPILSNVPVDPWREFAHQRETLAQLAIQDLCLRISEQA